MSSYDSEGNDEQDPGAGLPPTHQPYGQDPYAPPPQPSYQPPYQQPPYGQQGWPQAPYGYGAPPPPNHPSATTAMVLGLVGLAGIITCGGITLVLSPFAWRSGSRAVREIDRDPHRLGGRDQANAGRIMGIIGTVLLVLGILALIGLIALIATTGSSSTSYDYQYETNL